jgi:hypothetical protein
MSIIDRILGRTPAEGPQIRAPGKPAAPVTEMPATAIAATPPNSGAEGVVRVYDQFGRSITIGRDAWRRDVLLPNLTANRDNPDALYELIVSALNATAVTSPSARWLADTDRDPSAARRCWGWRCCRSGQYAAARDVLERAIARHGETAYLLANPARAWPARRRPARRGADLAGARARSQRIDHAQLADRKTARQGGHRRARGICACRRGLAAGVRSCGWPERSGGRPGRSDAPSGGALDRASPVPADLLMQLSGDLGNRGHTDLLVRLTQPRFDLEAHGLTWATT